MITGKTKVSVPMGGIYAAIVSGLLFFLGTYAALYARVGQIEANNRVDCVILQNIQNYTVPIDKRIARKCE